MWKEDHREGKGVFLWANGDKFEGKWKKDKIEGKGVLLLKNGEKYEGIWENDKLQGIIYINILN